MPRSSSLSPATVLFTIAAVIFAGQTILTDMGTLTRSAVLTGQAIPNTMIGASCTDGGFAMQQLPPPGTPMPQLTCMSFKNCMDGNGICTWNGKPGDIMGTCTCTGNFTCILENGRACRPNNGSIMTCNACNTPSTAQGPPPTVTQQTLATPLPNFSNSPPAPPFPQPTIGPQQPPFPQNVQSLPSPPFPTAPFPSPLGETSTNSPPITPLIDTSQPSIEETTGQTGGFWNDRGDGLTTLQQPIGPINTPQIGAALNQTITLGNIQSPAGVGYFCFPGFPVHRPCPPGLECRLFLCREPVPSTPPPSPPPPPPLGMGSRMCPGTNGLAQNPSNFNEPLRSWLTLGNDMDQLQTLMTQTQQLIDFMRPKVSAVTGMSGDVTRLFPPERRNNACPAVLPRDELVLLTNAITIRNAYNFVRTLSSPMENAVNSRLNFQQSTARDNLANIRARLTLETPIINSMRNAVGPNNNGSLLARVHDGFETLPALAPYCSPNSIQQYITAMQTLLAHARTIMINTFTPAKQYVPFPGNTNTNWPLPNPYPDYPMYVFDALIRQAEAYCNRTYTRSTIEAMLAQWQRILNSEIHTYIRDTDTSMCQQVATAVLCLKRLAEFADTSPPIVEFSENNITDPIRDWMRSANTYYDFLVNVTNNASLADASIAQRACCRPDLPASPCPTMRSLLPTEDLSNCNGNASLPPSWFNNSAQCLQTCGAVPANNPAQGAPPAAANPPADGNNRYYCVNRWTWPDSWQTSPPRGTLFCASSQDLLCRSATLKYTPAFGGPPTRKNDIDCAPSTAQNSLLNPASLPVAENSYPLEYSKRPPWADPSGYPELDVCITMCSAGPQPQH